MKYFLIIIVSFSLLSGCDIDISGENEEIVPHFSFSSEDKLKIVNTDSIGNNITFKNQYGEKRVFNVTLNKLGRDSYSFGTFWGANTTLYFTYDTYDLEVSYADSNGYIRFSVHCQTYPQTQDFSMPYNFSNPKFSGSIDFILYNKLCEDANSIMACDEVNFNEGNVLPIFNIDNTEYNNVLVFYSQNNSVLPAQSSNNGYQRSVNKIYYSYAHSIIGFNEVDGTKWRRIN